MDPNNGIPGPPRIRDAIMWRLDAGWEPWIEWVGRICLCLCRLSAVALVAFLIVWAVLQPHKPHFIMESATLPSLNISLPHTFSPTLQVTINLHNRNHHIGIHYDQAVVHATYRDWRITYDTVLYPWYQGIGDTNLWSFVLNGNNEPLGSATGYLLVLDQEEGNAWIRVKIFGSVRWRVGRYVSKPSHLHVDCPAYISLVGGIGTTYPILQPCRLSV